MWSTESVQTNPTAARRRLVIGAACIFCVPTVLGQRVIPRVPRIGVIDDSPIWDHFRQGLRELGYVDGQNIRIEYRAAEGKPERLAQVAAELSRLPVDVIVEFGTPAAVAAKSATTTIPIVMISIGDPVKAGLVASLARPGGNLTGNTILGPDLAAKRLQLLHEALPSATRVAFLWNPDNASNVALLEQTRLGTQAFGLKLISVAARSSGELEMALAAMLKERPEAFVMTNDPLHQLHIGKVIEFMAANRLPAMYQTKNNAQGGGLMSYGASLPELFRQGARYVDRILKGAQPADLPVEQPIKFELVINMRTASSLGLALPESLLLRADEVIR